MVGSNISSKCIIRPVRDTDRGTPLLFLLCCWNKFSYFAHYLFWQFCQTTAGPLLGPWWYPLLILEQRGGGAWGPLHLDQVCLCPEEGLGSGGWKVASWRRRGASPVTKQRRMLCVPGTLTSMHGKCWQSSVRKIIIWSLGMELM